MKLLRITNCRECPHYWFNRGRFECYKMERAFKNTDEIQNIPEWCPLEDIEEGHLVVGGITRKQNKKVLDKG